MTNRFSNRISGCPLMTLALLGLKPAVSFASIPPGRSLPASADNINAGVLPVSSQPYLLYETADQVGNQSDDRDDQNPGVKDG
jgi:hypothetical protein